MSEIKLREDYIKLGQALKAAGSVGSGVDAKFVIQDGRVKVNGETEYQRGKILYRPYLHLKCQIHLRNIYIHRMKKTKY